MTDTPARPPLTDPIGKLLAGWHANPVPVDAALALRRDRQGAQPDQLTALILRFWRAPGYQPGFVDAIRHASDDDSRALLELVYGQLLIAVRLRGAIEHLDRGFALAAERLGARDYLTVLNRHDTLRWLVLSPQPAAPMTLTALLRQAEVTRRLRAGGGEDPRFAPGAARRPRDDDPEHREDTIG